MEKKYKFQENEKCISAVSTKSFDFCRWRVWQILRVSCFTTTALALGINTAYAQIIPDNTLGNESSKVTSQEAVDTINGGAARGANLFHSFSEFNVNEGRATYFVNRSGIDNIITRVTGANSSNILGTLGVKGGNANLFLLNPNGIIFGADARLDVNGSFIGSTASNLEFADGNKFSTTASQTTPLLTVSVPIGLRFGTNPGNIDVQGNGQGIRQTNDLIDTPFGLRVQPDQTLALVGGDLKLEGATLKTAGGRIELGSIAAPSFVSLHSIDKGWKLEYLDVPAYGNIHLSKSASIDASGKGGGDIQIEAKQLTLQDDSLIEASTLESQEGGTLAVNAKDSLEIIGSPSDDQLTSGLFAQVYPGSNGSGGNINIETGRLTLRDGGQIFTGTYGKGAAGSLGVLARDSVEVVGFSDQRIFSGLLTSVDLQAEGIGGNINIETGQLTLRDGGQIFTGTYGKGAAGFLRILARDSVEVGGVAGNGTPSSLSSRSRGNANAGNLSIETKRLSLRDKAQISTRSTGSGNAGILDINANTITLNNQGKFITTSNSGEGGDIFLRSRSLQLLNGSSITTDATAGSGNGGNIKIDTDLLTLTQGSKITADAVAGNGGNININTSALFQSPDSPITATSQLGINGTIRINTLTNQLATATVELPQNFVDVSKQIAQACPGNVGNSNSFVITGRGGLAPDPMSNNPLELDQPWIDDRPIVSSQNQQSKQVDFQDVLPENKVENSTDYKLRQFIAANSAVFDPQGNIVLVASNPNVPSLPTPLECFALR